MMMITLGMIIILTVLTLVALLAIVARSERLTVDLVVPLKSINEVAPGNVKRGVRVRAISLTTHNNCTLVKTYAYTRLYFILFFCSFAVQRGEKVHQKAYRKI